MRESEVQCKIIKKLEVSGWLVVKIIQTNKNGWPDLQAHRKGITVFIEVKASGKKAAPLQIYRHNQLTKQGFLTITIDSANDQQLINLCQ